MSDNRKDLMAMVRQSLFPDEVANVARSCRIPKNGMYGIHAIGRGPLRVDRNGKIGWLTKTPEGDLAGQTSLVAVAALRKGDYLEVWGTVEDFRVQAAREEK